MPVNPDVLIRIYRSTDREGVIALWDTVFPDPTAWNRASDVIDRKLAVQPELFLIAVIGEQLVGTVLAGYDGVRGWIHRLAVEENVRRQGVATALMRSAEASLQSLGCPKLNLQVRARNDSVVRFYEALGYTTEDRVSLGRALN